ncbi:MAG TPA: hypothetical protein VLM75_12640 [Spirochaetota bacterium]|nr:hypothetical protein [Spirochaetota bacterium]
MKSIINKPLSKWWNDVKEHYRPDEILKFLQNNRHILEDRISRLDNNKYLYRWVHRFFSLFSEVAGIIDRVFSLVLRLLLLMPVVRIGIQKYRDWINHLNFREFVEFIRAKMYSLRHPPHNEGEMRLIEEIMEYASKHGFDYKTLIPGARKKYVEKKNQLMQHKYFQEFSKTVLERLLAIQFSFHRNIFPVLPDSAFWHKFFEFLERRKVIDVILVNKNEKRTSFKSGTSEEIASTDVMGILKRLTAIKNAGRRIFFIGHHEGYLGPYFVRSVIRKLGFDTLTKNCNTVVGPRMFSNLVLRNGAANVGNLFLTVPSQKTTSIQTRGLAEELRKTAKRTQCLIKMPDPGLKMILENEYADFMNAFVRGDAKSFEICTSSLELGELRDLRAFFKKYGFPETMKEFSMEDYTLFKNVLGESFLIFPEGSRSYVDPDGAVVMKYINPKYFEAYMRPGDYIAPVNLVGGSDLTRGWRLKRAMLGISMDDPFEVTAKMLKNFEEAGLAVMKKIAALPNIKIVRFKEEIQFRS